MLLMIMYQSILVLLVFVDDVLIPSAHARVCSAFSARLAIIAILEIITSTAQDSATLISVILSQFPWKRQPIAAHDDTVKY